MIIHKEPKMMYGIQLYKHANEDNLLYILAYIIDNCNYSCQYCYNVKPYSNAMLDLNQLYDYICFINTYYPSKYIQLELIGGEPTLHPDLLDFCEKIKKLNNILIKIFTNLSLNIDNYIKLLSNDIILIASWHSLHNDNININFIDKIIKLSSNYKTQLEVRIMFEIFNSENAIYVAKQLINYLEPMQFDLSYIFDAHTNDLLPYTDVQIHAFNNFHNENNIRSNRKEFFIQYTDNSIDIKTFTDMFCNKSYSFKRWLCNAGKNSLFINYDGLVYPCVEYSFDKNNSVFSLYNKLLYKQYKFKKNICKIDYCSCDWDIKKKKIFN